MKICQNCVLPETFPGIRFNKNGVCHYCQDFKGKKILRQNKVNYRKRFDELIKKYKGKSTYDALMSYSGGKDSTYVLSLLREKFGLNVLAVTFDNGFLPERTFQNIQITAENLGCDHIFFKPRFDILRKIFVECSKKNIFSPTTITRASPICTSCMAIVKYTSLRIALENRIPLIVFGWSPGQIPMASSIMKNNPQMVKKMQQTVFKPIYNLAGDEIKSYFLERRHFEEASLFPYNVSPLSFFDYDEEEILERVARMGWKAPDGVDVHSTNCLLNSYANRMHIKKYGFHPYVFELAKLVREGYMERDAALKKLSQREKSETIERVRKKLGLLKT